MFSRVKFILLLFSLFLLETNLLIAQNTIDSTKYSIDFKFNDGIFLNFQQAKRNIAIPFKNVISSENYRDEDYAKKVLEKDEIKIFINGEKRTVFSRNIWGYAHNGVLYIQYLNHFFRIPSIGSISFFIANVEVQYQANIDPWSNSYYGAQGQNYTTTELQQYILDFQTGLIYDYSTKSIEKLIASDKELHTEFTDLKKRKQKQMAFIYIRRFNELHPLYFHKY